jgi:hypothetical protein
MGVPRSRFGLLVACACLLAWIVDGMSAVLGRIQPVSVHAALAFAFAGLTWILGRGLERRRVVRAALLGGIFIASLAYWPLGERKAFFRRADALEVGMARAEARDRMSRYPMNHPYGPDWSFSTNSGPTVDVWSHDSDSFDHVIVRYDGVDHVRSIERLVD